MSRTNALELLNSFNSNTAHYYFLKQGKGIADPIAETFINLFKMMLEYLSEDHHDLDYLKSSLRSISIDLIINGLYKYTNEKYPDLMVYKDKIKNIIRK